MTDRAGTSPHHRTSTLTSVPEVCCFANCSPLSGTSAPLYFDFILIFTKKSGTIDNVRLSRCFYHHQACPCQGFRQGSSFHLVGHSLYVVLPLLYDYCKSGFNWLLRPFVSLNTRDTRKNWRLLTWCFFNRSRQQAQRSRQNHSLRRFADPIVFQFAYPYSSIDS